MRMIVSVLAAALLSMAAQGELVGQWTFEDGSLKDTCGNFTDLELFGNARIVDGMLDLYDNGRGWANALYTGANNGGAEVTEKTMVAWVILRSVTPTDSSVLTFDRINADVFDGIVWAERGARNSWMNGSNSWTRSNPDLAFPAEADSGGIGEVVKLAFTYAYTGDHDITITAYRNDVFVDQRTYGNQRSSFEANESQVWMGLRHHLATDGGIDALVLESRIYGTAMSQAEIAALAPVGVPEPATVALLALGGLAMRRRK